MSTIFRIETEHTSGKSFQWKSDHPETMKPIKTILKVESIEKEEPEWMTTEDFPASFSQFKEGSRQINETKVLEWMDAKVKTKRSQHL